MPITVTITGREIACLAGFVVLCCVVIAVFFRLMDRYVVKDRTRDVEFWNEKLKP